MDINVLFRFFSIIVQLFGGLIAILSVFMVYALQCIQQSIELIRQDLCRLFKHFKPEIEVLTFDFRLGQVDKFIRESEGKYNKEPESSLFNELNLQRGAIKGYQYRVRSLKENFFHLLKLMILLLIITLCCLFFTKYIASCSYIKWPVSIFILLSSIGLLIKITFFIKGSLSRQVVIISEESKV